MAARTWILAILLGTAVLAAGCTNDAEAPERDEPAAQPPPADPPANDPPAQQPPPQPPAAPADFTLADRGSIEGRFEKSWDIQVANVAFGDAAVHFALEPFQAGAPPTALIHLTLFDPNGAPVQRGTVGLGAPSNELSWSFSPGQLPLAGTYRLTAASAEQAPVPSGGFAVYDLQAHVSY